MHNILQNLRLAFRQLRQSPGFSLTVIFTFALGIGATTIMFSLVENVLLRPLPYTQPQQLAVIRESVRAGSVNFSDMPINAGHLYFWRQQSHSFQSIAAIQPEGLPIGRGETAEIGVAEITRNFFSVLGTSPQLGRTFTAAEEEPQQNVVVLTDSLWRHRFGANPRIVGKSITLNGANYEVIGVMPRSFVLPSSRAMGEWNGVNRPIEAFIPFGWSDAVRKQMWAEGDYDYFCIARLRPGVSVAAATAEINTLENIIARHAGEPMQLTAQVTPFQQYLTGSSQHTLLLLLAAVCGILLIACINVANLLLVRAMHRAQEAAIRLALGASPAQLLQKAMMEPLLLSLFGCAFGVLIAVTGLPLLLHTTLSNLPLAGQIHVNLAVLCFAVGLSLLAALGCGLLPALRYARSAPQDALRSETRSTSASKRSKQVMKALVASEIAASVVLVLLAALFASSLANLFRVPRGFQSQHVISAEVVLPAHQYGQANARNAFYERVLRHLRELPGVRSAGMISVLPLDGDYWVDMVAKPGESLPYWQYPSAHYRWISPGYFQSMEIPLVAGRYLRASDQGKPVAVISEYTAKTVWPGQNPIGKQFRRGDPTETPFRVIGVVGNVRTLNLAKRSPRIVYVPYWYRSRTHAAFVIRASGDPAAMAGEIRKTITALDPGVAVPQTRTMQAIVHGSVATRQLRMNLLLAFACCSLLLAAIGLYGVVSYQALQRTYEIGIRMALGSDKGSIYWLILKEGLIPVILGSAAGLVMAMISGHFIAAFLFGVHPDNPLLMLSTCAILLLVSAMACLLPARRAAHVNPVQALRSE